MGQWEMVGPILGASCVQLQGERQQPGSAGGDSGLSKDPAASSGEPPSRLALRCLAGPRLPTAVQPGACTPGRGG